MEISYGVSPGAEEAACAQTLGFFERITELADGEAFSAEFTERFWRGDRRTAESGRSR